MTRLAALRPRRRTRRSYADPAQVQVRDHAAWWAWTFVVARQMARLPAGRLVTTFQAFEDLPVLSGERKGDVA